MFSETVPKFYYTLHFASALSFLLLSSQNLCELITCAHGFRLFLGLAGLGGLLASKHE